MSRVVGGAVVAAVVAVVGLLGMAGTGSAAFPGPNGRITVQVAGVAPNSSVNIGIINPNGSGFRLLTNHKPGGAQSFFAAWSPNGKKLAFDVAPARGGSAIWVMNPDGSGKRLVAGGRHRTAYDVSPFWASNRLIVFARFRGAGQTSIWAVRADGVGPAYSLIPAPPKKNLELPAVSPDGKSILVTETSATGSALAIAHGDGSGLHVIPGTAKLDAIAGDFSPDGRWIVTSNNASNGKVSSLIVLHPDGTRAHRITYPGRHFYNDLLPVWSPDGTQVAFTRTPCPHPKNGCPFGHLAVWVVNAEGGGAHRIIGPSTTKEYLAPDWGRS